MALTLDPAFQMVACLGGYIVCVDRRTDDGKWITDNHTCTTHEEVLRLLKACLIEVDGMGDDFRNTTIEGAIGKE